MRRDDIAMTDTADLSRTILALLPTWATVGQVLALALIAGVLITPLEAAVPAHRQSLWRRKGLSIDLLYWFVTPLVTRTITGIVLGCITYLLALVVGGDILSGTYIRTGFGPISRQSVWLQVLEILAISDFVDYWTHRALHVGSLWRVHAIHHSPEEMSWLSSSRVHPLNDLITRGCQLMPIMLLGFSAETILAVVPFISFYVMFLHSNVRWDFGPFRWIFVSPAFHRWHHASDAAGIDKNFSGIFPIWDLLFGTSYFPRSLPKRYGLRGDQIPDSMVAHLLFPFRSSGQNSRS